jgi:hypothetical protein
MWVFGHHGSVEHLDATDNGFVDDLCSCRQPLLRYEAWSSEHNEGDGYL